MAYSSTDFNAFLITGKEEVYHLVIPFNFGLSLTSLIAFHWEKASSSSYATGLNLEKTLHLSQPPCKNIPVLHALVMIKS